MKYTFDNNNFGITTDGNQTVNFPIARRPMGLMNKDWYKFAGELARYLNLTIHQDDNDIDARD